MTKILLVEDYQLIREAMKNYISSVHDLEVVAEAQNGKEALQHLQQEKFDLVITDVNMPKMNGIELVENIAINYPGTKILIQSMYDGPKLVKQLMTYGANGFVMKNTSKGEFLDAISHILLDKKYVSREIKKKFRFYTTRRKRRSNQNSKFSNIESRVLKSLVAEKSLEEISNDLNTPLLVIRLIIKNLYQKTGCSSVQGLITHAL